MSNFPNLRLDNTDIVAAARELARDKGKSVGNIGRVSVDVLSDYLLTQPKTARELARFLGVELPSKGRLPKEPVREMAAAIR